MSAPKKNKFAAKYEDELIKVIPLYIKHIESGYSKSSFPDCDYRTIESHIENDQVLHTLKKEIEKAKRIGRLKWEKIGETITNGTIDNSLYAYNIRITQDTNDNIYGARITYTTDYD